MKIFPQKLAVRYTPPRLCLIYQCNNESFFHDFPISQEDMKFPTDKVYTKLNFSNPGYLDQIDKDQVCTLIDLIKTHSQKSSKAQRLRGIVTSYKNTDEIEAASHSESDQEGVFDFNQVEKQFDMSSDHSDSDIDLKL